MKGTPDRYGETQIAMTADALQVGSTLARRVEFLGCPLDLYTSDELLEEFRRAIDIRHRKCVIHFLNGNKIAQAYEDPEMREILWRGDFVLADGQPLLPMARLLQVEIPERIDGIGLMEKLLELANQQRYRIFLLGAKQTVLEACVATIQRRFPDLVVAGHRNGYFQDADLPQIVEQINATKPDILFIGIGTPTKERLADQWGGRIEAPVIQGVGGSFDVMAGLVKRAPRWMQRLGLEWFYRVIQEPRRMFWRYLKTNAQCLALFASAFVAKTIGSKTGHR
jgi:N-acetylglucosaminyldiphosphoundecaprenol N-acetyl-beta-D-mannosaminyltransferase